ncbi:MAG: DNA repair protein RecO [Candidatus Eremiobacteraeota bacterium]|nr:DNA repair protein RecO [Candidatus Eremiobacteraeota bacterium]
MRCAFTPTGRSRRLKRSRRLRTQPRAYKTRGIVLRGRQLGEADRIFTVFTTERGKLDAVAKGVRRAKSHLAGRLEFGNECEFGMHRGRSLDVIVSAHILHAPWSKLVEPERFAVASLVAELVESFCEPDLAQPEVYELLSGMFAAIERAPAPRALLARFSLRLLDVLGLAPPPDDCVRCGQPLAPNVAWVDAPAGGLIDDACRERWRDLLEFDAQDRQNFRALCARKGDNAAVAHARPRVASAVDDLIAHHLGRRPKAGAHLSEFVPG